MRMDKLTSQFQKALADAQSLALGRDHQFIEPLHLLSAMLAQDGAGVGSLLARAGVAVDRLRADLGRALDRLPRVEGTGGDVQLSQALGRLLNLADKYAQKRGDDYIASEMFLLAAVEDTGELGGLLKAAGATRQAIDQAIDAARAGEKVTSENAEENRGALDKYTIDLTNLLWMFHLIF